MADIKFSEFPKANQSKDSDEIAILQDGVNKMIASPVLESKIINKTVSRVIDQGGASLNVINLKGVVPTYADLATITPTPELNDAYQVEADGLVYVYTESGFQADGDGFKIQLDVNGVVEEGNTEAVSGGEVYDKLYDPSVDYLHLFKDANDAVIASIDNLGNFSFYVDEDQKKYLLDRLGSYLSEADIENINVIKEDADEEYIFKITDAEDKIIFSIDKNGLTEGYFKNEEDPPVVSKVNFSEIYIKQYPLQGGEDYIIDSTTVIVPEISLPTIAVGRETAEGLNDAPLIPLTTRGLAHPSVVYIPSGWNGFKYWMAFTPYFAPTVGSEYENPHIMCSLDGKVWQEPAGIQNPIDLPDASPGYGYWSDTHLKLGDDGYLHIWYRGNYLKHDGVSYDRFVVHRKSRNGVNWSDKTLCWSTADAGLRDDNALVSPAFIKDGSYWNVYDVLAASNTGGLAPAPIGNQSNKFIMRRQSFLPNTDYEPYATDKIINFTNRPWGLDSDTWHLDCQEFGNSKFMLLSVGLSEQSVSHSLWLAYSGDGWNFTVIEEPITLTGNYRSCMVFKESSDESIRIDLYQGDKSGKIELKELTIKKNNN